MRLNSSHHLYELSKMEYRCEICDKTFNSSSHLNRHKKIHDKPYKCDKCPEQFGKQCQLNKHVLLHSVTLDGRFPCSLCVLTFPNYRQLTTHLNHHTQQKSYKCEICGDSSKEFYRFSDLVGHRKTVHFRQFQCEICKNGFATQENLEAHMNKLHSDAQPQVFECTYCKEVFSSSSNLRCHVKAQHLQSIFSCDLCDKTYKWRSALRRHIVKVHSSSVPAGNDTALSSCHLDYSLKRPVELQLETTSKRRKEIDLNGVKDDYLNETINAAPVSSNNLELDSLSILHKRKTTKKSCNHESLNEESLEDSIEDTISEGSNEEDDFHDVSDILSSDSEIFYDDDDDDDSLDSKVKSDNILNNENQKTKRTHRKITSSISNIISNGNFDFLNNIVVSSIKNLGPNGRLLPSLTNADLLFK